MRVYTCTHARRTYRKSSTATVSPCQPFNTWRATQQHSDISHGESCRNRCGRRRLRRSQALRISAWELPGRLCFYRVVGHQVDEVMGAECTPPPLRGSDWREFLHGERGSCLQLVVEVDSGPAHPCRLWWSVFLKARCGPGGCTVDALARPAMRGRKGSAGAPPVRECISFFFFLS
jgi:hypothetical protein